LLAAGTSASLAQNIPALRDSSNFQSIQFQQNFNTYQWDFNARHIWQLHPRITFSLNHNFISSLLKLGASANKWKDNQSLDLQLKYRVGPDLAVFTSFSSLDFADQQTGVVNDLKVSEMKFGAGYLRQKSRIFMASGSVGSKADQRYKITDQGFTSDFNLKWPDFDLADYHNSLFIDLQNDYLGPRRQRDAVFYDQIFREFDVETTDTLTLMFDQKRRDYYISYAGDIERFEERNFLFNNKLRYRISDAVFFHLMNEIKSRAVDVSQLDSTQTTEESRRRSDFRSDNKISLELKQKRLNGRVQFGFWSQEQKYTVPAAAGQLPFSRRLSFIAPDNTSYLVEILTQLGGWLSARDSLGFGATLSRLQYDTPDTSNFDDRDELRWEIKLCETHLFSPQFKTQLEITTGLYHLAYIYGERSADNNWNRIFRLKPQMWYRVSDQILWNQSFEVLANYVDYDFELAPTEVRSFVYRKFAGDTNLNWHSFKTSSVSLGYRLELEENGKLYWERWAERPLLSRTNQWLRVNFVFSPRRFFQIIPGMNYYTRHEWKHVTGSQGQLIKEAYQDFQSYGPTLSIQYFPHEKLRFSGVVSRNKITGNKKNNYYINNISINLNWHL